MAGGVTPRKPDADDMYPVAGIGNHLWAISLLANKRQPRYRDACDGLHAQAAYAPTEARIPTSDDDIHFSLLRKCVSDRYS